MASLKKSTECSMGINANIAREIVELHKNGFALDFEILSNYYIFCLQENCFISLKDVSTALVDQCFKQVSHCNQSIALIPPNQVA